MFSLTFSIVWSFSYFYSIFYILLVTSIVLYLLPLLKDLLNYKYFKKNKNNEYLTGFDLYWILITFVFLILFVNATWSSPSLSAWFGHLIFTALQKKMLILVSIIFALVILVYTSSFYLTSRELYDYWLTCLNFYVWIVFLFFANTIFTVIFFVEILSTLIFLLLITSVFSTTYFYNNTNLNLNNYFTTTLPNSYLQTLMFFFWISLISSLNLFFFLTLFYLKFLTFDWYVFEVIFYHLFLTIDVRGTFSILVIWAVLLFCIFLKCGLVPFYFWKPTFFRGMPFPVLFLYIVFFYFFIFLFFILFFLFYLNEIFYFFIFVINFFLLVGFLFLLVILCEAYYVKIFLALSSILNTLFVFLALSGVTELDVLFI